MVKIKFQYSAYQDNPFIELDCTEVELAEAFEELDSAQFIDWVSEVASGATHAEAMEWARGE